MAIAFGEATKTVPFVADARKAYRFTVRWGAATATDDAEGAVVATSALRPDAAAIRAALPEFTGEIMQVPPQVSAVKVDGERAYARARAGEVLDLAARPLTVERLELVAVPDADSASFEMVCGKGGYVRSIARDLGERLGCLGHVAALRRLWSGPFSLDGAIGWDDARGRGAHAGARGAAAAGAGGARGPARARLPAVGGGAAAERQPGGAAGAALPEGATAWASLGDAPLAVGTWRDGRAAPEPGLRAAMSAGGGWRERARRLGAAPSSRGCWRCCWRSPAASGSSPGSPTGSTRARPHELRHPHPAGAAQRLPIRPTRSAPDGSRSSAATSPRSAASAS